MHAKRAPWRVRENHMLRMKMQLQCFEVPMFLKRRPDSIGDPDFCSGAELELESLATTLDVDHRDHESMYWKQ